MPQIASLTRQEAQARAALISVERYDIACDLRGLLEGEVWESTSTITFTCREPGAETFVDCAAEIRSATLNGEPIDVSSAAAGRLPLPGLAAENVLVVSSAQSDTDSGAGVRRTVDPTDKLVYVWSSLEPDMARRLWACFDQPDLKAVHGFTVSAPESWTVTSNSAPDSVSDLADGGRLWTFGDTPRLSTYVVVVNAGPFHELRSRRGDHDLGLYCRQSLAPYLERDAEELFDLTDRGLRFFGERFGQPFPQERYDQVFVPNMGGAMENWGSVTWGDGMLYRTPPTYSDREWMATVLLHEMAHMWFGDLVTMQWWDDLWLNEAFASWAASWALASATSYDQVWAGFLAGDKRTAYRVDLGPGTHPIRAEVPDVAQAMANFDQITYLKGQSVLKQLTAYVGEDAFVEGLRAYFRDHAWGNTRLQDLMDAFAAASGRDLDAWTAGWLDRDGTDTLRLVDGVLEASGPGDTEARPHRLDIGCYAVGEDGLDRVAVVPVETTGPRTPVDLPSADLYLVNDGDLTFASARSDDGSTRLMLDRAAQLPDPLSRALAVATASDMLLKSELSSEDALTCVLDVLDTERTPAVIEPFLELARSIAEAFTPVDRIAARLDLVAERALALADHPEVALPALRTLAWTAGSDAHFAVLDRASEDSLDLAWRTAARRAALGEYDATVVEALLERDPDPDAASTALGVRAASPDPADKAQVWEEVWVKRSVPGGDPLRQVAAYFWRPVQHDVLVPFAHAYLDEMPNLAGGGMLTVFGLMRAMFPAVGDRDFVRRSQAMAAAPDADPTVRATLLTGTDTLARMLRARGVPVD